MSIGVTMALSVASWLAGAWLGWQVALLLEDV